jgi:hypothetical protein
MRIVSEPVGRFERLAKIICVGHQFISPAIACDACFERENRIRASWIAPLESELARLREALAVAERERDTALVGVNAHSFTLEEAYVQRDAAMGLLKECGEFLTLLDNEVTLNDRMVAWSSSFDSYSPVSASTFKLRLLDCHSPP